MITAKYKFLIILLFSTLKQPDYELRNGSRVGVVGAGPAGTFFSYFLDKYARERNIELGIVIFDKKKFYEKGIRGCNMCAGIISSNLVEKMNDAGIKLPENVVQRYIRGYVLETKAGSLHLEKRTWDKIATVFRGRGPRGSELEHLIGFDEFLLSLVSDKIELVPEFVNNIEIGANNVKLETDSNKIGFDAVVIATGLNSAMPKKLELLDFGYKKPAEYLSIQTEIPLEKEEIAFRFGDYIYSYNLGINNLKFAAIIPKKGYLTVSLVGKSLNSDNLFDFLSHPRLKRRFPPKWDISEDYLRKCCLCKPFIPVGHAKNPYTDRLAIIGDANCSRLFKNGLESAFISAEAAAKIMIEEGFSKKAFKRFDKKISELRKDNFYGRVLFSINQAIAENNFLSNSLTHVALREQLMAETPINDILWDMLTGEDSYRHIFSRLIKQNIPLKVLLRR